MALRCLLTHHSVNLIFAECKDDQTLLLSLTTFILSSDLRFSDPAQTGHTSFHNQNMLLSCAADMGYRYLAGTNKLTVLWVLSRFLSCLKEVSCKQDSTLLFVFSDISKCRGSTDQLVGLQWKLLVDHLIQVKCMKEKDKSFRDLFMQSWLN